MSAAKRDVEALLEKLPDECTLEDIQYHLYVLEKIQNGIAAAEAHGAISREEAGARLARWFTPATGRRKSSPVIPPNMPRL